MRQRTHPRFQRKIKTASKIFILQNLTETPGEREKSFKMRADVTLKH